MPLETDALQAFMDHVSRALYNSEERMDCIQQKTEANTAAIHRNTEITEAHRNETRELIDAFNAMKGGLKVLEGIGKIGKIIGGIAAGGTVLVAAYQAIIKFFK